MPTSTAPAASAFENDRLTGLYDLKLYIAQRRRRHCHRWIFSVAGLPIPPALLLVIGAAGILVGVGWMGMEVYSQIGKPIALLSRNTIMLRVGVLMGLAEYFFLLIPRTRSRLASLSPQQKKPAYTVHPHISNTAGRLRTSPCNLDMVGAGSQLQWVSQEGVFFPVKTDKILNRFISMADDSSSAIWYTRRSGDYLPFLEHHIPAASLQTSGHSSAERHYHTIKDGMKNIPDWLSRRLLADCGEIRRVVRAVWRIQKCFQRKMRKYENTQE